MNRPLTIYAFMIYAFMGTIGKTMAVPVGPSTVISVTIALPQRNIPILADIVRDISDYTSANYGRYLSRDQILDLTAPDPSYVNDIIDRLAARGISCLNYRDALKCTGVQSKQDVSDVGLFAESTDTSTPCMPNEIRPMRSIRAGRAVRVGSSPDPGYAGRESLLRIYNITGNTGNPGNTSSFCAAEYQGSSGFSQDDVTQAQTGNSEPYNPLAPEHIIGVNGIPDDETELDLQMASILGPGTELWYWSTTGWLYSWAVEFFNSATVPMVVSHSWGWAIDQQCMIDNCGNLTSEEYVNRVNAEYLKIAARGVTMLAASGDSGATGRSNEVCQSPIRNVNPIFPGSSPWILSVGATYIAADKAQYTPYTPLCQEYGCINGTAEYTVNFVDVDWTAGGGFSKYPTEFRPSWQEKAVSGYLARKLPMPATYALLGRAYPDVSMVGHNCPTLESSQWQPFDGTSCSSPLFAAVIVLLNNHQIGRGRPPLGLAAPLLYSMWGTDRLTFNDITKGNNWCTETMCCPVRADGGSDYGYLATVGYDPVTGLGTPNVKAMLAWLDKHT